MPRGPRYHPGGMCFHVLNRANRRETLFHRAEDYEAFMELCREAMRRRSMRLLAWCLMPNHFHFVVRPWKDDDLGRWMHWLMTSHVTRYCRVHGVEGRIWQNRYKSFPVQTDMHLLTVMRYVERNPLRANLVRRAEQWIWSSLRARRFGDDPLLSTSPVPLGAHWIERVNEPVTTAELEALRTSVRRGRPFGDDAWTRGTAERLGLLRSVTPRGRPRKYARRPNGTPRPTGVEN